MRLVAVLACATGCVSVPEAFVCQTDAQCIVEGVAGSCEANQRCSLPDDACPGTGRRYRAAGPLDGTCVLGTTGGASRCGTFTGLACQGFEDAAVSMPWEVATSNGSATRDTTRVARGNGAMHFTRNAAPAMGRTAGEASWTTLPSSGVVGMRAFFFFPSRPPEGNSRILDFQMEVNPYNGTSLRAIDGKLNTTNLVSGDSRTSSIAVPTGRWACLELVVTYGNPGLMQIYLDGQELPELAISAKTVTSPPFVSAIVGTYIDDPGTTLPAYDFWVDEIAIDSQRIGCDR